MGLLRVIKHLPGRHSQLRHGRRMNKIPLNPDTIKQILGMQKDNFTPGQLAIAMDNFKSLIDGAPVCMRVPAEVLGKILESGRFKNQHETGTSRGILDVDMRRMAERNAFGYDLEKPTDFPIYGYIGTGPKGLKPDVWYGDVKLVLKDDVKQRTTVTYDDSLAGFEVGRLAGTPLLNPSPASLDAEVHNIATKTYYVPYVEAQIHNGLSVKDVAHAYIPKKYLAYRPQGKYGFDLLSQLREANISYTIVDTETDELERFQ